MLSVTSHSEPPATLTPHQAKLFAYELSRQGAGGDRLSQALFNGSVDLNPHQVDAALFALRAPLSRGVLLADEVGLGKTIEAAIVLCQLWAERKRRLLVICLATIRRQWASELGEKFALPAQVLDSRTCRQLREAGRDPFQPGAVVIMSHQFAARMAAELRAVDWDLVVIDEAHKLRNAHKSTNRVGQALRWATEGRRKLLLTATPLQNSLIELYGLSTLIDEHLFGDVDAFRAQYTGAGADLQGLRRRLATFCKRTLRRQVTEYIRYTERHAVTRPFLPTDDEHAFYEAVSAFLQREESYALPARQRHLTVLVMRKLLASSPQAIAGTLDTLTERLVALRDALPAPERSLAETFLEEEAVDDELLDEILAEDEPEPASTGAPKVDRLRLLEEIATLQGLARRARGLGTDTKTRNLLKALEVGFEQMRERGAQHKALIFTESRRTQEHLRGYLEASGYAGQVVVFNGTNQGPDAQAVYEAWRARHAGTGRVSGSRDLDIRTALVERFETEATILLATEAAAEGVNLQCCSLVINFDLPWNPQRVEQRIGRCHRYGQRHDVVVINFLNERNHADRRVLELLTEKFNLFDGVFGASDDVLGSIESGVDFERRILDVYQACRTTEAIDAAFGALRKELEASITAGLQGTRQLLLEHFDEDVHERLRMQLESAQAGLDRFGRRFWALTRFVLGGRARFDEAAAAFELTDPPLSEIPAGRYELISRAHRTSGSTAITSGTVYRLSHPLGEHVVAAGRSALAPAAHLTFDTGRLSARVHVVEALVGTSGWATVTWLAIDGVEREEQLLYSGTTDAGSSVDGETLERLFTCPAVVTGPAVVPAAAGERLAAEAERHRKAAVSTSAEKNHADYRTAREKLERWAEDKVVGQERALLQTKEQIKVLRRDARHATTLEAERDSQAKIASLEQKQREQRLAIFAAEDAVKVERDQLMDALERRIAQRVTHEPLITVRWSVR